MTRAKLLILHMLIVLLPGAGFCPGCSRSGDESAPETPSNYNVILIVADAMRQDVAGCYGGQARTPNLDRLSERGALFRNAYSTSPWTTPSSVSMFTGNYASSFGHSPVSASTRKSPLQIYVPDNRLLLMEVLKQKGYITPCAMENANAAIHNNLQGLDPIREAPSFEEAVPRPMRERIMAITGGGLIDAKAYRNAFVVLKQLLELPAGRNFFFVHWMLDPHYPYDPVEKFKARIEVDESSLSQPVEYYAQGVSGRVGLSAAEQRYVKDLYAAEVESVDEIVGLIMKMLEHKKLLDKTYVVFTADHGEQFGDHGLYGHGGFGRNCHYYEGLVEVPLIVTGPDIPAGLIVEDKATLLGLMPTLKDLLAVDYDDNMQGRSWRPLIFNREQKAEPIYLDDVMIHDQQDALIENDFKLICWRDGRFELYNLAKDEREANNLALANQQLVESMYRKILAIRGENKERKKQNVIAMVGDLDHMTDEQRQKVLRKLRSLGYIK
jgi:arylsulfatase A-like enzyme